MSLILQDSTLDDTHNAAEAEEILWELKRRRSTAVEKCIDGPEQCLQVSQQWWQAYSHPHTPHEDLGHEERPGDEAHMGVRGAGGEDLDTQGPSTHCTGGALMSKGNALYYGKVDHRHCCVPQEQCSPAPNFYQFKLGLWVKFSGPNNSKQPKRCSCIMAVEDTHALVIDKRMFMEVRLPRGYNGVIKDVGNMSVTIKVNALFTGSTSLLQSFSWHHLRPMMAEEDITKTNPGCQQATPPPDPDGN
ncbi:hypothetical protein EI94DRAFT_1697344 [Lactarius quietus]|nr:hypothetical protein EI94DRAFT_1697344 [Lactarius quietus]